MTDSQKKMYILGCIVSYIGLAECSDYLKKKPRSTLTMAEWVNEKIWGCCFKKHGISEVDTWPAVEELIKQIRGINS